MNKHAAGKWDCEVTRYAGQYLIPQAIKVMGAEDAANARLIAAAPDLLDALENICAGKLDSDEMKEIARTALAKVQS